MPLFGPIWVSRDRDSAEDEGLDSRTKKAIKLENNKKVFGGGRTAITGRANKAIGLFGRRS